MTLEQKISTLDLEELEELLEVIDWALIGVDETTPNIRSSEEHLRFTALERRIRAAIAERASSPSPSSAS